MEKSLILETTFLIDLEREHKQSKKGPAHNVLKQLTYHRLFITDIIAGELAAGKSLSDRDKWERFIGRFRILVINDNAAWEYGKLFRYLKQNRLLIGSNDLWIAATALAYDVPVVTRNVEHYRRVPGLKVLGY